VGEEGDGDSRGEGDMCDGSGKGEEGREFGKGGVRDCDREASDVEGEELGQGMSRAIIGIGPGSGGEMVWTDA